MAGLMGVSARLAKVRRSRMLRVNPKMVVMGFAMVAAVVCAAAVVSPSVSAAQKESALGVKNLRCEYKVDPMGIDVHKPRLSWELVSAEKGVMQTSYEVRVAVSEVDLTKGKVIWDSGTQAS